MESPVIRFSENVCPIFGSYIHNNQTIQKFKSGFRIKTGKLVPMGAEASGHLLGWSYDEMFREDYTYVEGLEDLDKCNSMNHYRAYWYYVTTLMGNKLLYGKCQQFIQ